MNKKFSRIAAIAVTFLTACGPLAAQETAPDIILMRPGALTLGKEVPTSGALKGFAQGNKALAHLVGDSEPLPWFNNTPQYVIDLATPIAAFLRNSGYYGTNHDIGCGGTAGYFLRGNEMQVQYRQTNPGQPPFKEGFGPQKNCDLSPEGTDWWIRNTGVASQFPSDQTPSKGGTQESIPTNGSIPLTATCGSDAWEPASHCGFFTVQLSDPKIGGFCSGVLISPGQILTAGHCICGRLNNGVLDDAVNASIGTGWLGSQAATVQTRIALAPKQTPVFFNEGVPAYCQTGLGVGSPVVRADLAILQLDKGAFAKAQKDFDDRGIVQEELGKLIAAVGNQADSVWGSEPANSHFHSFGFGEGGPGQTSGVKRAVLYTARTAVPCPDPAQPSKGCDVVKEVFFQDDAVGICAGDSGGGVFKFAKKQPKDRAVLALMGIVSGTKSADAYCQTADGELLVSQHRRNIVRIDTPEIREWLKENTNPSVTFVDVRTDDPSLVTPLP